MGHGWGTTRRVSAVYRTGNSLCRSVHEHLRVPNTMADQPPILLKDVESHLLDVVQDPALQLDGSLLERFQFQLTGLIAQPVIEDLYQNATNRCTKI